MRIVAEIPHSECKITVFSWNNKYLIKFEQPLMEQTYKISEYDLTGDEDIKTLLTEEFINEVLKRFLEMRESLAQAMQKL